jgi:transcriptional regulator with XRE-family HTH domain
MSKQKPHSPPWFGPFLSAERTKKNKTVQEVADDLGIHASNVHRRERGLASIPVDDLPLVLLAYGIAPATLAAKLKERIS